MQLCEPVEPVVRVAIPLRPGTAVGRSLRSNARPSSPKTLLPQQNGTSLRVSAHVWPAPAEIVRNVSPPLTARGLKCAETVLSPNSPPLLVPQQYAAAALVRPQVCPPPAVMLAKLCTGPTTGTGVDAFPLGCTLAPQQYAASEAMSAQVCDSPAAMAVKFKPPDTATGS